MSWLKDVGNIFVAPSYTFNAIKNAGWKRSIAPFLILVILGAFSMGILQDLMQDVQYDKAIKNIEESTRIPDDQKSQFIETINDRMSNPQLWQILLGWLAGLLSYPIRVFITTLFVMIIGNTILGGSVKYGQLMIMTSYVYLISILEMIVKIPLMLSEWSIDIYTGLGLLGIGESGSFVNNFMAGFDLFGLWRIILLAIGMGIFYEKETKPFLWALLIYWVIQITLFAGLGMIF
ncbi:YIP1 family protein [Candidatus Neomarinimicrobiota bacterium]